MTKALARLFITDAVTGVNIGNAWLIEGGIGCGSSARGIRGEFVVGYHGKRDIVGMLGPWFGTPAAADPLHTSVQSTFNGYYDLARFDRFTPYLGAGVGLAYNRTGGVSFIEGESRWSLAWSLMAGVGIQIPNARSSISATHYFDMGKAESGVFDNLGFTNLRGASTTSPPTSLIKVGLRFALAAVRLAARR
jgi:opacity protein-like surface antigen